ncbi:hypothetical protein H0H87_003762 [Tephrocybe sp. NHM501043]|nr:hypothetical protein H0H87_003762 [Tephrocybe sp. NHM501043]
MTSETESEPSDKFSDALYLALAFNPGHIYSDPDVRHAKYTRLPPTVPLTFYDRHIDERLQLKHVRPLPLDLLVSQSIYVVLESFRNRSIGLPSNADDNFFPFTPPKYHKPIFDALSLANTYQSAMAFFASDIASMLVADLQLNGQDPFLLWKATPGKEAKHFTAYTEAFGLQLVSDMTDDCYAMLDSNTRNIFRRLWETYPVIAWWEVFFLSEDTETLIKALGGDDSIHFHADVCQTSGFRQPPASTYMPPNDAAVTPWGDPLPIDQSNIANSDVKRKQRGPPRRSLRRLSDKNRAEGRGSNRSKLSIMPEPIGVQASWPDITISNWQDPRPLADRFVLRVCCFQINAT